MLGFQPRKKTAPPEPLQAGRGFRPRGADGAAFAQAQNQQPDSIPGMFKPGEFVLPPDTVHALGGKAVLQSAVDKTHTPSNAGAEVPLGFKPELFFAQGGAPEDELKKANNFGDAAAAMNNAGVTTPPAAAPSPGLSPGMASPLPQETGDSFLSTPAARAGLTQGQMPAPSPVAPPAVAPAQAASTAGELPEWSSKQMSYGDQMSKVGGFIADIPKHIVSAPGYGFNSDMKPKPAISDPTGAGAGRGRVNPPLAVPEGGAGGGRGFVNPASTNPALPTLPATQAPQTNSTPTRSSTGMVTREGNSYSGSDISGDITINGAAPRNGGRISAQNDMAAENLARGFRPGMGSEFAAAPQPELGFGPGSVLERQQQGGFTGVIGQQSGNGNMWSRTPEQQRRDAEVQASSIHKPTSALGVGALRSMDAQDLETTRGFNNLQREAMQQTGANARAAGQNAAELQRAVMREGGENTRFGFRSRSEAERTQIERDRLGMEQKGFGFKTRAAERLEGLQSAYAAAKTPEERNSLATQIRQIQGNEKPDQWAFAPGGQTVDPKTGLAVTQPGVIFNKSTGQTMGQPQGQEGQTRVSSQAQFDALPKGATYVGDDGKMYRKPA